MGEGLHEAACGHHHEHDHLHDHDHEHEHEHRAPGETVIEMTEHEQAVIGTVRCSIDGAYEEAREILKERMEKTAEAVEEAGGLVGHIKCFAIEQGRTCMISIPEPGDVQVKEGSEARLEVQIANIVFGVGGEKLEAILKELYPSLK